jgi:hypothetical protein
MLFCLSSFFIISLNSYCFSSQRCFLLQFLEILEISLAFSAHCSSCIIFSFNGQRISGLWYSFASLNLHLLSFQYWSWVSLSTLETGYNRNLKWLAWVSKVCAWQEDLHEANICIMQMKQTYWQRDPQRTSSLAVVAEEVCYCQVSVLLGLGAVFGLQCFLVQMQARAPKKELVCNRWTGHLVLLWWTLFPVWM